VGRSTKVRDWGEAGAFIGFAEPLPSGTAVVLKGDGVEQPARVVEVIESADPAIAGMQVRFVEAAEAARPAPKPAAPAPKPQPARAPQPAPAKEPVAAAPPPAAAPAPAASAPAASAPAATPAAAPVVEAAPIEVSSGGSSAVPSEVSGPATAEHGHGDPDPGQGSGGKRRRRRR
jgi:2-oxoglutarate dehydrogenase E2 component (dihydrolipoamide succinyltransferase)